MEEKELGKQLIETLKKTLRDVPFLKMEVARKSLVSATGIGPDLTLAVYCGKDRRVSLFVEIQKIGQPRLVREAINKLFRYTSERPDAYGIVAAPYISPAAAQLCEQEGVGYIDLAGNCRLVFGTVYIVRNGTKNPFVQKRDLRSLYSPRGSRILRVMLSNPKVSWKTQPLARSAEVSIGQVANIKKLLKDREWIIEGKDGFLLKEPAKLLNEWSECYSFRNNDVREFYTMSEMPAIEAMFADACARLNIRYAVTGLGGGARMQPGIRYQRTMAYISEIPDSLLDQAGLKEVTSGANVTLLLPYDDGIFNGIRNIDGIPVVSPVQLYLDLKTYKGRGEEAAQIIYDKMLSTSW